ncbi:MAG: 2Fe-2S iron-sulfur cluster binding domain-containing protein [Burkholderiales bacterium]|nr:2Fe-2S iron-sulfur cluster binding domain-containing protein [Burkholderiales bacterium]
MIIGGGFAIWRRRAIAGEAALTGARDDFSAVAGAWPGLRDFRIVQREFEDAARCRITIKRAAPPAGRLDLPPGVSSSHFLDHIGEGDVVQAKAPAGRFFIDPDAGVPATVLAGGIGLTWNGPDANPLDFAERHDLSVDSGCRTGSCGACETRLVSGVVEYADKPDHDIASGQCLLCVGKPRSALVLDA